MPHASAIRTALALVAVLALAACATPPAPPPPLALLHDARFGPPTQPVQVDDLFALDDRMRGFLRHEMATQLRIEGVARGLMIALHQHGQLQLDYDAAVTRTAAQAFEARMGNCLSLVIMTAAFARELHLDVTYQLVWSEETWNRIDELAILNKHVNVVLGTRELDRPRGYDHDSELVVDFIPAELASHHHSEVISEDTIVAMYMNNRAAEALSLGRLDDAYAWSRAALLRAPGYRSSFNTLAIIYLHHGDLEAAESVLREILAADRDDVIALSNLQLVLARMGRGAEARAIGERLARLDPYPPYHFFWLGKAALARGDYAEARTQFSREVNRAAYSSEFHFWLGVAELKLGHAARAQEEFTDAREFSTTRADRDLYAAKLARLQALHLN